MKHSKEDLKKILEDHGWKVDILTPQWAQLALLYIVAEDIQ